MNLKQEHRELIETIVRQSPSFAGREEHMEQICAQIYKKSYLLLDSVSNINNLKNYLSKVAETSIANVIVASQQIPVEEKNEPIFQSLIEGQGETQTVDEPKKNFEEELLTVDEINELDVVSVAPRKKAEIKVVNIKDSSKNALSEKFTQLIDPVEFYPKRLTNPAIMGVLIPTLKSINSKFPNKKFGQIFKMRHVQNMRQAAIARKLKISQSELSRRYCEMVKYLSQAISSKG